MSSYSRLNKAFKGALRLPLNDFCKYVIISDCHRGTGTSNDNFLKNQHLYFAALQHYFIKGFTYIELGDGDELWENRSFSQIIETHSNVFWMLSKFYAQNRLYMLYGNHDIVKKDKQYSDKCCKSYHRCCNGCSYWDNQPLLPGIVFHEGIILKNVYAGRRISPCSDIVPMDVYLTHGHQTELLNSTFWPASRFLVRYLWGPLERVGVLDPTSAARNNKRKYAAEKRLHNWAEREKHILITGHTHRPALDSSDPYYCNSGSCVHPRCITCLEIEHMQISLVKWTMTTRPDMSLYVEREVLAEGFRLV
ncbi:MAG: metallophosphoesterase [Bacteroides sp.]